MLRLVNISKKYDRVIFDNFSCSFPSKGFVFITGENGVGKTTLFNIILGIEDIDKGEIFIDDKKILKKDFVFIRKNYINVIFQDYGLIDYFSIEENLKIPLLNVDKKYTKDDFIKVLKEVNLDKKLNELVKNLSGGEKQRLAIARTLLLDKNIYLCDEPTGSLDQENTTIIFDILKKISLNKLVICISHDQKCIDKYADIIINLNNKINYDYYEKNDKKVTIYKTKNVSVNDKLKISYYSLNHHKLRSIISIISNFLIFLNLFLSIILSYSINNNISDNFKKSLENNFMQISMCKKIENNSSISFNKTYRPQINNLLEDLSSYNYKIDYCYDYFFLNSKIIFNHEEYDYTFKPLEELPTNYLYLLDKVNSLAFNEVIVNDEAYKILNNNFDLIINKTIKSEDNNHNIAIDNLNLSFKFKIVDVIEEFGFMKIPLIYYSNERLKEIINNIELTNYSTLLKKKVTLLDRFRELSFDNEEISSYKYNIWTNEIKKINDHLINKGYNVICSSIDNEKNLKDILSTINLTFNLFLIISFVITFFLMGIIIYSLIMERKREIALMKINGLNNKDVKSIINFDAVIISLISFLSVVIILNFVLNIFNKYLKLYLKIDNFLVLPKKIIFSYDIYLYLLLFCLLIGLLFSFIPLKIYLSKKECDLMREE